MHDSLFHTGNICKIYAALVASQQIVCNMQTNARADAILVRNVVL